MRARSWSPRTSTSPGCRHLASLDAAHQKRRQLPAEVCQRVDSPAPTTSACTRLTFSNGTRELHARLQTLSPRRPAVRVRQLVAEVDGSGGAPASSLTCASLTRFAQDPFVACLPPDLARRSDKTLGLRSALLCRKDAPTGTNEERERRRHDARLTIAAQRARSALMHGPCGLRAEQCRSSRALVASKRRVSKCCGSE